MIFLLTAASLVALFTAFTTGLLLGKLGSQGGRIVGLLSWLGEARGALFTLPLNWVLVRRLGFPEFLSLGASVGLFQGIALARWLSLTELHLKLTWVLSSAFHRHSLRTEWERLYSRGAVRSTLVLTLLHLGLAALLLRSMVQGRPSWSELTQVSLFCCAALPLGELMILLALSPQHREQSLVHLRDLRRLLSGSSSKPPLKDRRP